MRPVVVFWDSTVKRPRVGFSLAAGNKTIYNTKKKD